MTERTYLYPYMLNIRLPRGDFLLCETYIPTYIIVLLFPFVRYYVAVKVDDDMGDMGVGIWVECGEIPKNRQIRFFLLESVPSHTHTSFPQIYIVCTVPSLLKGCHTDRPPISNYSCPTPKVANATSCFHILSGGLGIGGVCVCVCVAWTAWAGRSGWVRDGDGDKVCMYVCMYICQEKRRFSEDVLEGGVCYEGRGGGERRAWLGLGLTG